MSSSKAVSGSSKEISDLSEEILDPSEDLEASIQEMKRIQNDDKFMERMKDVILQWWYRIIWDWHPKETWWDTEAENYIIDTISAIRTLPEEQDTQAAFVSYLRDTREEYPKKDRTKFRISKDLMVIMPSEFNVTDQQIVDNVFRGGRDNMTKWCESLSAKDVAYKYSGEQPSDFDLKSLGIDDPSVPGDTLMADIPIS